MDNSKSVNPNHYGASDLRVALKGMADGSNTTCFTTAGQGLMNATTVTTNDTYNGVTYAITDKLYALEADDYGYAYKTIKAGSSNQTVLARDSYWSSGDSLTEEFWLRSPRANLSYIALLSPLPI